QQGEDTEVIIVCISQEVHGLVALCWKKLRRSITARSKVIACSHARYSASLRHPLRHVCKRFKVPGFTLEGSGRSLSGIASKFSISTKALKRAINLSRVAQGWLSMATPVRFLHWTRPCFFPKANRQKKSR